jgi:3-oxoacyl-[acyl-carrier protein] reductase
MELKDSIAIVTGGGRGIGRGIAQCLARAGANIVIADLPAAREDVERTAELVEREGAKTLLVPVDVRDWSQVEAMAQAALDHFGRIDVLVNNAGVISVGGVVTLAEEDWDRVLDVNLKGCFNYCRAAAPLFRAQDGGKILNIASINGLRGKFGQANYAASKGGMIALTKTLARELGKFNVNVNALAPGMVLTEMMRSLPGEFHLAAEEESVFGRIARPEEVASVAVFLVSEKARHITGEVVRVDGGQYI